jgi:hypothetical protein
MASDTVPAAAPGPADPGTGTPSATDPTSPHTPQGGLTGLLAPIQPARFSIDPANAGDAPTAAGTSDTTGLSSADFHDADGQNTTQNNSNSSGKQQQSIWRAWMLAGAERWKKGADARNKALDIKKARAQALQIKESRTVNRSEKVVSGSSGSGNSSQGNAGKSLNSKSSHGSKGSGSAGPKNGTANRHSNGSSGGNTTRRTGRAGGSGGSGSGGGGARPNGSTSSGKPTSSGRDTSRSGTSGSGTAKPSSTTKDPAKPSKTDGAKPGPGGSGSSGRSGGQGSSGSAGGKSGGGTAGKGPAGKDGKPGKDAPSHTSTTKAAKNQPSPKGQQGHDAKPSKTNGKPAQAARKVDLTKKPSSKDPEKPGNTGKTDPASPAPASKDNTAPGDKKQTAPNAAKKAPAADASKTQPAPTGPVGKRRLNTQESREAGYRDGVRAAVVASHVGAWRDGVRDGWTDTKQEAAREKARLDQAHTDRKNTPTPTPAQQPKVPPMPSEQPTAHQGPQPIQVTAVTQDGVNLGAGANRTHLGHGEVRSLKHFERALTAKSDTMARIAEGSLALQAHAEQQLKHITAITEQARQVEGGEKLLSALLKLEEAAKTQASSANEIVTRAARAHEACNVLIVNVDTRYGPIYKAVVDSGLIAPANMHYYKDTANV